MRASWNVCRYTALVLVFLLKVLNINYAMNTHSTINAKINQITGLTLAFFAITPAIRLRW